MSLFISIYLHLSLSVCLYLSVSILSISVCSDITKPGGDGGKVMPVYLIEKFVRLKIFVLFLLLCKMRGRDGRKCKDTRPRN